MCSLHTLDAAISDDSPMLASGRLPPFPGGSSRPAGFLQRISTLISSLFSFFLDFSWRYMSDLPLISAPVGARNRSREQNVQRNNLSDPASKVRIPSLKQQILNHGACDVCGCLYVPQIAENRRFHRKHHAEHLRPRFPKPNPRLADYSGDVKVDASSPRWLHQLVYDCARALKREERYDLVQWDKRGDIEASDDERMNGIFTPFSWWRNQ